MIPVTLITGFLGSGKTTLLKQISQSNSSVRLMYLINDFSAQDVDSAILNLEKERVISVPGGSIFCSCKVSEFVAQLEQLKSNAGASQTVIDGLVIEASGMADPTVIDRLLQESGLSDYYMIARIVCVVDPLTLPKLYHTLPNIKKQISAANLVLLNKTDLVSKKEIEHVESLIHQICGEVAILKTTYCKSAQQILDRSPGRSIYLAEKSSHPPQEQYEKFSLKVSGPLSMQKIKHIIVSYPDHIFRIKGFIRNEHGEWCYLDYSLSSGLKIEAVPARDKPHLEFIYDPQIRRLLRHDIKTLVS